LGSQTFKRNPRKWVLLGDGGVSLRIFILFVEFITFGVITNWISLQNITRVASMVDLLFTFTTMSVSFGVFQAAATETAKGLLDRVHAPLCTILRH
jgi:hypothetical protein